MVEGERETIHKCFRNWNTRFDVVACPSAYVDPFLEADIEVELQGLIERALPESERCIVREYVEGYDDLPVCTDLNSENFCSELGQKNQLENA